MPDVNTRTVKMSWSNLKPLKKVAGGPVEEYYYPSDPAPTIKSVFGKKQYLSPVFEYWHGYNPHQTLLFTTGMGSDLYRRLSPEQREQLLEKTSQFRKDLLTRGSAAQLQRVYARLLDVDASLKNRYALNDNGLMTVSPDVATYRDNPNSYQGFRLAAWGYQPVPGGGVSIRGYQNQLRRRMAELGVEPPPRKNNNEPFGNPNNIAGYKDRPNGAVKQPPSDLYGDPRLLPVKKFLTSIKTYLDMPISLARSSYDRAFRGQWSNPAKPDTPMDRSIRGDKEESPTMSEVQQDIRETTGGYPSTDFPDFTGF